MEKSLRVVMGVIHVPATNLYIAYMSFSTILKNEILAKIF